MSPPLPPWPVDFTGTGTKVAGWLMLFNYPSLLPNGVIEIVEPDAAAVQAARGFGAGGGWPAMVLRSMHNPYESFAKVPDTMRVVAKRAGIAVFAFLPESAALLSDQIRLGVYDAMSPSFIDGVNGLPSLWSTDPATGAPVRTIRDITTLEGSAVDAPAWQGTSMAVVGGFRSFERPSPVMTRAMLDSAFARISRIEDEDRARDAGRLESAMAVLTLRERACAYDREEVALRRSRR